MIARIEPVTIVFDGPPRAQARARFGRGRAFTAPATRQFQNSFGWQARAAMIGRQPIAGAVALTVRFELKVPRSWSERKRTDAIIGLIPPISRPDLDNFLKAALDACNGIVFADDAHITEISAKKIYGVSPKTVFTIQAFGFEKGP